MWHDLNHFKRVHDTACKELVCWSSSDLNFFPCFTPRLR